MLKTDSLYNFLAYFDECPIGAFKLTENLSRQFESSVKKLVVEAEKEIRANVLNLNQVRELIYLKETIEVLVGYQEWLTPNCWAAIHNSTHGLFADFEERPDEETKNFIKSFNIKCDEVLCKISKEDTNSHSDYYGTSPIYHPYSPALFREFFLGIPEANLWSYSEEEHAALCDIPFEREEWGKLMLEQFRQDTLAKSLIYIWELLIKMYERRTAEAAPNAFLHEYYTQYCSELSTNAPNRGSGYERFGLPIAKAAPIVTADSEELKNGTQAFSLNAGVEGLINHEKAVAASDTTPIAEEFRRYLPGFLAGRRQISDSEILTDWGFLVSEWRFSGSALWLRQRNFEQLLDHHHDPNSFLVGLEYLLGLLEPLLLSKEGAVTLFGNAKEVDMLTALHRLTQTQGGKEVDRSNDPPIDVEKMRNATAAGVTEFRKWIKRRQRSAHTQIVEELRTIQFIESDELDRWGGPLLTIPLLSDKDEAEYPAMLLRRFDKAPRPRKRELREVLHQLCGLMNLPLARVIDHEKESLTGAFHLEHLVARYSPEWHFPGLADRHVIQAHWLTPRLWQELVWSFIQRIKWAWRFHNQVATLLGKSLAPYPLPRESPSVGDVLLDEQEAANSARPTANAEQLFSKKACHCQRQGDAARTEELCVDCPIIAMLQDPLATAHVRAEMRTLKELKLPEQYHHYCTEKLEHHANLAAQLANEMNKPGGWNAIKMEVKFYNAAVAKLYREELTPKPASLASASITPLQTNTLNETPLEIHSYYSKLFEAFAALPPADIGTALFERACELWAEKPWDDFGRFLNRIESYLEQSQLSPERRAEVLAFLDKQKPHYERGCWLPETRPRVIKHDEQDLQRRLVAGGIFLEFENVGMQDRNIHLAKVRAEIEQRLSALAGQREASAAAQPTQPVNSLQPQAAYRRTTLLSDWSVLLTDLDESKLRAVASEMGLFREEKAPSRAWAGLVLELKKRHYLPEDANTEALVRAFATWDVVVPPNSIRTPAKGADHWQRKASDAFKMVLDRPVL
jgi:hypothetical protein